MGEIARRYFALNAFDGALTILGVLVGSYFGQIRSAGSVITLVLTASFAIGISGFYGAYMIERAERRRSLAELERSTLSNLEHTEIGRASVYATIVVSLVDGLSPFGASLIAVSPFFFGRSLAIETEFYTAFALAFAELFGLGIFLGLISREHVVFSGFKMVVAGLLCLLVGYLLKGAAL